MAAHRYWRLYITESTAGESILVGLYEVEMRATAGSADQCNGGTASASHNNSTAYRVFDNNTGSYWVNGAPYAPSWLQYDFGSGVTVSIGELAISARSSGDAPKTWDLQWSDDGTNFTTHYSWSNVTGWIGGTLRLFTLPGIAKQWNLPYAITVAVNKQWNEPWAIQSPTSVVNKQWRLEYGSIVPVDKQWSLEYESTVPVDKQWRLEYGSTPIIDRQWSLDYGQVIKLDRQWTLPYDPTTIEVHRYWRMYVTESNMNIPGYNFIRAYELEFRGEIGGIDLCNGGTPTASHNNATVYRLFNNNITGDDWISGGPSTPVWIQYDFGEGNEVSVVEVKYSPSYAEQTPKAFSMQWSDDGLDWHTAYSWVGVSDWVGGVPKLFVLGDPFVVTREYPIFPSLPGVSWQFKKSPEFNTSVQTSTSGREQRGAFRSYPLWRFTMIFNWLRIGHPRYEYETLQGFVLGRRGSYESFLFLDPDDSVCVDMPFGVGDGNTTVFQLTRAFGFHGQFGFVEPVENVKSLTSVKLDGVESVLVPIPGTPITYYMYSVNSSGKLTFSAPPPVGVALTWSGEFYFRCRFAEDSSAFERTFPKVWELRELTFIGSTGNKV